MKAKRSAVVTGLAIFAVTTLALHLLQPALSPRNEAVSYYVHGNHGWLLTLGLIALGTASLVLTVALVRATSGPGARAGRWLLGIWSVGVLLGGVFPADPAGNWSAPPSVAGMIHGNAAMVGFLALHRGAVPGEKLPVGFTVEGRGSAAVRSGCGDRSESGGLLRVAHAGLHQARSANSARPF